MAGTLKTSQFNSATVANPTDEVPLLQGGQLKRVQVKVLTGNPDVGWQASGESWVFSSYSATTNIGVVTVPSDATTKYAIGMFVRIAQATGGTKYGKIIGVTSTTLSIWMIGYTLNNEAVTTSSYSPLAHPVGLPVTIAEGNPFMFRAYRGTAWTPSSSGNNTVPLNQKLYDLVGAFNTTTFQYTIQASGYYRCTARISIGIQTRIFSGIIMAGTEKIRGTDDQSPSAVTSSTLNAPQYFNAGDVVSLSCYFAATGAVEYDAAGAQCYLALELIGR